MGKLGPVFLQFGFLPVGWDWVQGHSPSISTLFVESNPSSSDRKLENNNKHVQLVFFGQACLMNTEHKPTTYSSTFII